MASTAIEVSKPDPFQKGESCLLNVVDEHFLIRILDLKDDSIRVSFPGRDYPVVGMRVYIEFHDESGFDCYPTHVLRGPSESDPSLELERPRTSRRIQHRTAFRIPTDLTVQVKDQIHVRRYDASLINLSSGGALIRSNAPFDFSTTVEMFFSLPGEQPYAALGQVVHISAADERGTGDESSFFGIRFIDLDPNIFESLARYIRQRLRDIYPKS